MSCVNNPTASLTLSQLVSAHASALKGLTSPIVSLFQSHPQLVATVAVGAGVLVFSWALKQRRLQCQWESQGLPVYRSSFVVGLFRYLFRRDQLFDHALDVLDECGDLFGTYLSDGRPVLMCRRTDIIKTVMAVDFNCFYSRISSNGQLLTDPISSSMLSVVDDLATWKRIRSVMSPSFSPGKLRRLKPLIDECVATLVNKLEQLSFLGAGVDVCRVMNAFATDSVVQVAFGTKIDSMYQPDHPLLIRNELANKWLLVFVVAFPQLARLLNIDASSTPVLTLNKETVDFYIKFVKQLIEERKNQKNGEKKCDFLQLMIDAGEDQQSKLSVEEITSQCFLFFFAASETTSALTSVIYNLAVNEDAQQKLYDEIAGATKNNAELDYNAINSLKYLECVLAETLRLFPVSPTLQRTAKTDYTFDGGLRLEKGTIVMIMVWALHRDPRHYASPLEFRPERFLDKSSLDAFAHLPFGAGPRNCVAMRLAQVQFKSALVSVVRRFKFSVTSDTKQPPKIDFSTGIAIPTGVMLRVDKRSD